MAPTPVSSADQPWRVWERNEAILWPFLGCYQEGLGFVGDNARDGSRSSSVKGRINMVRQHFKPIGDSLVKLRDACSAEMPWSRP